MRVHDREPIGSAMRRFKKLMERSGLQKELRKRRHYEKPCELRRRAKLRKLSAIRKSLLPKAKKTGAVLTQVPGQAGSADPVTAT